MYCNDILSMGWFTCFYDFTFFVLVFVCVSKRTSRSIIQEAFSVHEKSFYLLNVLPYT